MADASLELQKAVVAALKADATLNSIIAGRVYAKPPQKPQNVIMPYVSFGPEDWIPNEGVSQNSTAGSVQIDGWSVTGSMAELKHIANATQNALHEAQLTLDTQILVGLRHRITRYFTEADGITMHAAMDFAANTQQPPPP